MGTVKMGTGPIFTHPLYSVPFFQEKTGCPSFFQAGCFEVKELKK